MRKVPETNVVSWPNLHDRSESTELQPATANFLLDGHIAVATSIRTPVGVAHHRGTLGRYDGRTQTFLGAGNVSSPELSIGRTAGVRGTGHEYDVVAAIFVRYVVGRLQVHHRICIAVFPQ
jgi:hypothetical protein